MDILIARRIQEYETRDMSNRAGVGDERASAGTVPVAGIDLVDLPLQRAAEQVARWAQDGSGVDVHLVNAYTVSLTRTEPAFRRVIEQSAVNFADGKPLTWAARWTAGRRLHQVRGPDLFELVLETGADHGLKHFLLGGSPDTLSALEDALARRHPGAEIVGSASPPFRPLSDEERDHQDTLIADSGANIVWIGLGTPKQDFETARLAHRLGITAVAVGAAFDFSAGRLRRAPVWVSAMGLEWFFRLLSEPGRLWRRYTIGNAQFLGAVLHEAWLSTRRAALSRRR